MVIFELSIVAYGGAGGGGGGGFNYSATQQKSKNFSNFACTLIFTHNE